MGPWLPVFPRRSSRFAPSAPQSRPGGPMTSNRPRVAVAAPNAAAADAGVRVAAEGGNAVDAAIAATLVTMVNEIGVVSPASGGFVTLQVAGGEAVTIDGWVEM